MWCMMKNKISIFRVMVAVVTIALAALLIGTVIHAIKTHDSIAGFGLMLTLVGLPVLLVGSWDIMHE